MPKLHISDFHAVKTAVGAAMPAGWRYRLANTERAVTLEIQSAPVDLLTADGAAPGAGYCKVNPTAYEDRPDSPLGALWRALNCRQTVEFDAEGERCGRWYIAELWVGHWRRPFVFAM